MKKLLIFLLALIAVILVSCGSGENGETIDGSVKTLYVYNWGEYISDGSEDSVDVNAEFEKYCREELKMNVRVNYSTYSSNEDMYAKLSSGAVSYDVIFPSDYMVTRLYKEGLLKEIDPEKNIPNFNVILDEFKGENSYYDPGNKYSVPYTFGTVGIIYNTEMVPEDEPLIGSWELMWCDRYKGNILQFNNPRDGFMTAQKKLGYSINSENPDEWKAALESLKTQKDVVQGYVMDEIFNKMKSGSAAISSYYAGDFFTMYDDNDSLAFYHPKEGTNYFVDAVCIPSCCQNYDLALEYINFLLTEEIAVANAEYICYASPVSTVRTNEEYIASMTEVHPDAINILYDLDFSTMEPYYDLSDDTRELMNSLWEELKIESAKGNTIYIVCAVIVIVIIAFGAWRFAVNKKRKLYK